MEFTPYTLLVDLGLISALLLLGTLARAVIKPLQVMMIPASVIAGALGLLLGPHVLGVLPFSSYLGTYGALLIALVRFFQVRVRRSFFRARQALSDATGYLQECLNGIKTVQLYAAEKRAYAV